MKLGIIKERKKPEDRRTPLTPDQCVQLMKKYPELKIIVEPSPHRCFSDHHYTGKNVAVASIDDCDIILGVKEIPPPHLLFGKTYLFFSHTIKMQEQNKPLIREVLKKKIRLIDYELLTDEMGNRLIGFGRWAGIVGAHYALLMWGKRKGKYDLKKAVECHDYEDLKEQYKDLKIPPAKIGITGYGRVGQGAEELLLSIGIKKVHPQDLRYKEYEEPVFAIIDVEDMYRYKDSDDFDRLDFYKNPHKFRSIFLTEYARYIDVLINAVYWDPAAPRHFTANDTKSSLFRIKVISDIAADKEGSVPITRYFTTTNDPVIGYDPATDDFAKPYQNRVIDLMTVDNLPNELPKDASEDFGNVLSKDIIPAYIKNPYQPLLTRATIAENGNLTEKFQYLARYAGLEM